MDKKSWEGLVKDTKRRVKEAKEKMEKQRETKCL